MQFTNQNPLISIIIATFNAIGYIEECLKSIIEQEFQDYEIIVIDGISTDGTIDVLNHYRNKIAVLAIEEDRGIYDAMNKGIAFAKGEFLYFMGADDRLLNSFSLVANFLKKDNTIIYYGDVIWGDSGKVYGGRYDKREIVKKNMCHQSIFYPKNVFGKYQYQLKYKMLADYELNIKLWGDPEFQFEYIPIKIALYSNMGESTRIKDKLFSKNSFKIVFIHLGFFYFVFKVFNGLKRRLI